MGDLVTSFFGFFGNDRAQEKNAAEEKFYSSKNSLDGSSKSSHEESINAGINRQQELETNFGLANGRKEKDGDTLWYPQELFTPSQPHGVHFYINARQTSVAAEQAVGEGADITKLQQAQEGYNSEYTAENRAKAEQYENVATGAGALAGMIGTAAGIASGSITKTAASLKGKVVTTVVGGGLSAILGKALTNNTTTIRLLKSIQLHIPASVVSAYAANWDETTTGIAGMLGSGKFDASDLLELPEFVGRGAITAAASVPKALGAAADFGAVLEATSKKVANPYKEQLFKSMGFRRFAFNYHFAPRNIDEAERCMEIINTFKYHMHPETSDGNMYLIYPAEFSIVFEILDDNGIVKRNPHLPKVSSCALTSVKATYGPDGFFNTFQNTDGIPSEMHLELMFTEL